MINEIQQQENYFKERLGEASLIENQNNRYEEASIDPAFENLEEFRVLTQEGLRREQAGTINALSAQDQTPYTVLANEFEETQQALAATEAQLEALPEVDEMHKQRLFDAARRAVELAPSVEDEARALTDQLIESLPEDSRKHLLAQEVVRLTARHEELSYLYGIAGQAWPLPQIPQQNPETPNTILEIDELPVEPDQISSPSAIEQRSIDRHGYTAEASLLATHYIAQRVGQVLTPKQIGHAIYTDPTHFEGMTDEEIADNKNNRINCLLYKPRTFVISMLAKQNIALQYGWRHYVDPATGKSVRKKRRIYRAVEMTDGEEIPETFTEIIGNNDTPSNQPKQEIVPATDEINSRTLQIEEIVRTLDNFGLLPKSLDTHMSIRKIHTELLFRRSELKQLKNKWLNELNKSAVPGYGMETINAHELVCAAIGPHFGKKLKRKTQTEINYIIDDVLSHRYENHEAPDTSSDQSS